MQVFFTNIWLQNQSHYLTASPRITHQFWGYDAGGPLVGMHRESWSGWGCVSVNLSLLSFLTLPSSFTSSSSDEFSLLTKSSVFLYTLRKCQGFREDDHTTTCILFSYECHDLHHFTSQYKTLWTFIIFCSQNVK